MSKINVVSERIYRHWPSYHVVYEWEDVFSKNGFQLVLRNNSLFNKISRKVNRFIREKTVRTFRTNGKEYNFRWIMNAKGYKEYTELNTIPIFLDFPINMVEEIRKATKELPFFWVTCLDVYEALRQAGSNNVHFIPLSISDKYYTRTVPLKTCDVIQFGRKNSKLHEYMLKYCTKKPGTEYVYQTGDGSLSYESTTRGNLGRFDNREEYFQMLASCRVSLVSSPGKDNSRDFGGIDFITPRFYESAVNYCHMIGRYTNNTEAQIIGIDKICPCVDTYEQFEEFMDAYLDESDFKDKEAFDRFLTNNVTSVRVQEVMGIVNDCLLNLS